jgi:VIT1/CCC1 family predicted Fe2+/Mn2+ transporter
MRNPLNVGLGFGLTSGVITTLGMIIGLNAATHSESAVVGGILTVALADAFSDALGIHITEESTGKESQSYTWKATLSTFFFKIIFALSFIVPFVFLEYNNAILACIVWAGLVIGVFSYIIGKRRGEKPFGVVFEHLIVSVLVVVITQVMGGFISRYFK